MQHRKKLNRQTKRKSLKLNLLLQKQRLRLIALKGTPESRRRMLVPEKLLPEGAR